MFASLGALRFSLLFLALCMVAVPAAQDANVGHVEGQIRFTGNVPQPKKILTTDGSTLLHSDLVVDPKSKGLRNVVVILENAPVQPKVMKQKAVLVDQRDMVFLPRVVAIQHGRTIRFENNDLCNHSVMVASP